MAAENKRSSSVAGDEAVAEEQQIDVVVSCAIDDFCDALVAERNASGNTVRAYRTDLGDYGRWAYREKLDALHASHRTCGAIWRSSMRRAIRAGRSTAAFRRCARFSAG